MKIWIILIFTGTSVCQTMLHQPEYRKIFAEYLYCNEEYLRAAEEYQILLGQKYTDTSEFKLILSFSHLGKYDEALRNLDSAHRNSSFSPYFLSEKLKILLLRNEYNIVRTNFYKEMSNGSDSSAVKLKNISYLYSEKDSLPSPLYFGLPFREDEKKEVLEYYEMKNNLPEKNPLLAGFLSAIIPGTGKLYTEEYGDAFFALLTTGIFAYLAYTNFEADHQFRAYLFSGIGLWFYASNIYGSAVSANIYNAKVNFSFTSLLDNFLKVKNYFLPDYGFCR